MHVIGFRVLGAKERAEQWFKWMEKASVLPDVTSYNSVINAMHTEG